MTYATERKAHVVYIIEGELDRLGPHRLTKQALMKHITRLMLRYHIAVFQTSCIKETAELCQILKDQITSDPTTFEQPATMTYIETRGNTRQGNTDDPAVFAANVLMCCRGISATGATALLAAFGSLAGVWNASREALAAAPFGKKSFGAAKAGKLYELLHGDEEASAPAPLASAPAPYPPPCPPPPAVTKPKKVVRKVTAVASAPAASLAAASLAAASLPSSCMIQDD